VPAVRARPVGPAQPRNADARAHGELDRCAARFDDADDLVARNDARPVRRQFAFDDVQVGAAHAARADAQADVAGAGFGNGALFELQRPPPDRCGSVQDGGAHAFAHIVG